MANGSAPRPPKSGKAPAPPPKPFSEKEQLALAKALRGKRKQPAGSMDGDDESKE